MSYSKGEVLRICKTLSDKYKDDFPGFVNNLISFEGLKHKGLTWQQVEIAEFLVSHKNVCVSAGGGIGKSALAALFVIWFITTHLFAKIPTTAPSRKQLKDVLWAEISFWLRRFKYQELIEIFSERLQIKHYPDWCALARTVPKEGNAATINDTLAGFHGKGGDNLMILVDEACHDDITEVLTDSGWKTYNQITNNDLVLTLDVISEKSYYSKPLAIHVTEYDGLMYNYESKTCNFKVSPKHKMLYKLKNNRAGIYTTYKAKEIQDFDLSKHSDFYMERRVDLLSTELRHTISVPGMGEFEVLDFCEFLGWYLSEGWIDQNGYVGISQQQESYRERICAILYRLNIPFNLYGIEIKIHNRNLGSYLTQFGKGAFNKHIIKEIKMLHKEALLRFLIGYAGGDGHIKRNNAVIYTMSKIMADDLQEITIKAGYYASIGRRHIKGQVKYIKDHFATTSADDYCVYISYEPRQIKVRQHEIEKVPYKGDIWCLSMPETCTFYVRRNGQTFWSHNSGVPDPVFTALEGAMTDGAYILLISNPVSFGGYYYDTINDPNGKGKAYKVLYYDSRQSPLVDQSFEERIIDRYGKDSAMYIAKVTGRPIAQLESVVCSPERFDRIVATNRSRYDGEYVVAVDVGGGGTDPAIICHRVGKSIVRWDEFGSCNPTELADECLRMHQLLYQNKRVKFIVDGIGTGAGVVSNLQKANRFPVISFMGSEKSSSPAMYKNKRSEGYYELSKNFDSLHFPAKTPERLKKELANLFFDFSEGPINMEPKKKFVGRIGFSPDHADALMMANSIEIAEGILLRPYVTKKRNTTLNILQKETKFKKEYSKFIV